MTGTKLYTKKSKVVFFLLTYALLAILGTVFSAQAISRNENPSGAYGFMVIFGAGMFFLTLIKSRRPQISFYEEYLTLNQSKTEQYIRYRNIVSVSRPDKNRIVVKLWEDNIRKDVTIWIRDFETKDIEKLMDFLSKKSHKAK